MTVLQLVRATREMEDLPRLAQALGCRRAWQEIPPTYWTSKPGDPLPCDRSALIGDQRGLPWYGVQATSPSRAAVRIASLLYRRGDAAAVLALDPATGALVLSVASHGFPVLSLAPVQDRAVLTACLDRIPEITSDGRLATAARLAEILALEGLGTRFFTAFEGTLDRVAESISQCGKGDRRNLALLQLTRVLFLYFVQSKGWLDGRPDFLRNQVDCCLARNKGLDRHLLRPLFFGTLNRPWPERSKGARGFGRIPFLNGGLFEPHPLERKWRGTIPNAAWRDTFDTLFERFHFTAVEGGGNAAIAPDMLGRVFEGVMVPEERRRSGTFYTPPDLVRALLDECLAVFLSSRLKVPIDRAAELLATRDRDIAPQLNTLTLLDPAAGSGAFLLSALERLSELTAAEGERVSDARRRILQTSLFGVDINPTAVRLTELRLWLSVIAEDDAVAPESVAPLPNLDCLVRQGDSLTDPLGLIARMPFRLGAMGRALRELRLAFSGATGKQKREASRVLRAAEGRVMQECLELAEQRLNEIIGESLRAARTPDLFGEKRGADRALSRRLSELRRQIFPVRQARRRLEQQGEIGWFQYESHFADVFAATGGFDLVIGNPPWVRAELLPRVVREHLSTRYCWWRSEAGSAAGYRHQPDLAVAFLERSHELARPGGIVGLLVPAKLGSAGYAAAARRALTRDLTLHVVSDLESSATAFDATVYPMALVSSKERPKPDQRVRLALGMAPEPAIAQSQLVGGGPWIIRRAGAAGIARDLAHRFPSIAGRHVIHLGVKTGANEVFLNPPDTVEPGLIRAAFRGRDIRPFRITRTIPLFWPCTARGKPLPDLAPGAMRHIRSHLRRLESRSDYAGGPPWTLFRTTGASSGARVVWADLSRTLVSAALAEDDPRIPLNTCYVLRSNSTPAPALAAWLNSSWMRGLARLQADPASGGFARFNARTVGSLPLPHSIDSDNALAEWAVNAAGGTYVQAELDELTAAHLDLPATSLRTLASVA